MEVNGQPNARPIWTEEKAPVPNGWKAGCDLQPVRTQQTTEPFPCMESNPDYQVVQYVS
jgi:hypothetical protein